jgi:dTDP-L-rhamnose 4-epimerase
MAAPGMAASVLITGGAGFIGSHLAERLLADGYRVRALDTLVDQVHGQGGRPGYLADEVELIEGDVRDPAAVRRVLAGIDAVVHLAARVGVGQSMYQVADYVGVADLGTAVLLEALIERPVERLIVASSMSIYGEGLYRDADGNDVEDAARGGEQLRRRAWEPADKHGRPLTAVATPEWKRPALASVYALTKFAQERLCLLIGEAYAIPTTALRFFNVFGTRQALSNPYTGVLAVFAARLLNGRPPLIFEDGRQRRDFVHVRDVALACAAALERPQAAGEVVNVGSGTSRTVAEVARAFATALGQPDLQPQITGRYRVGDIRHCFADTRRAREVLDFAPREDFEAGLAELAAWVANAGALDRSEEATSELAERGLVA